MDIHIKENGKIKHVYLQKEIENWIKQKYILYIEKHKQLCHEIGVNITPLNFKQFVVEFYYEYKLENNLNDFNSVVEKLKEEIKRKSWA